MHRLSAAVVLLAVAGCGFFRDGRFEKSGVRYRVAVPPGEHWKPIAFADNDLAWLSKDSGHVISVNATCKDYGDPSLEVLTTHLLLGFQGHVLASRKAETLDGRAALRSRYHVTVDGVPAEVEVVVLKKNGCVHDFTYVSPQGQRAKQQPTFDALVAAFAQEASP